MNRTRLKEPHFTGFKSVEGDTVMFYILSLEHTHWTREALTPEGWYNLTEAMLLFYNEGVEAVCKYLEGQDYIPAALRNPRRFRLVSETDRDWDYEEPLAWSNELGWVELEYATRFTEDEARDAPLVGAFRVEEIL